MLDFAAGSEVCSVRVVVVQGVGRRRGASREHATVRPDADRDD